MRSAPTAPPVIHCRQSCLPRRKSLHSVWCPSSCQLMLSQGTSCLPYCIACLTVSTELSSAASLLPECCTHALSMCAQLRNLPVKDTPPLPVLHSLTTRQRKLPQQSAAGQPQAAAASVSAYLFHAGLLAAASLASAAPSPAGDRHHPLQQAAQQLHNIACHQGSR
ncbi:hypothetical protein COO60DRAFT_1090042 [Scenedesmus sp. NREL 46B-D3]|nr:hypothetical protein COO60DRAFT_1090042 [Scenedesmus sp. NREL 46B-D3]